MPPKYAMNQPTPRFPCACLRVDDTGYGAIGEGVGQALGRQVPQACGKTKTAERLLLAAGIVPGPCGAFALGPSERNPPNANATGTDATGTDATGTNATGTNATGTVPAAAHVKPLLPDARYAAAGHATGYATGHATGHAGDGKWYDATTDDVHAGADAAADDDATTAAAATATATATRTTTAAAQLHAPRQRLERGGRSQR